jgi:biopolymer transport protein ExbD
MRRTDVVERVQMPMRFSSLPVLGVMPLVLIAWIGFPPPFMHGPLLPQARTAVPLATDGVMLAIDREGRFHLRADDTFEPLPPPRLSAMLAEAYATRPGDHALRLWADTDASYAHVLTALDAARQAGVRRVDILADIPRSERHRVQ